MGFKRKAIGSVLVVSMGTASMVGGTFALFTANASNTANTFTAGTLTIQDLTGKPAYSETAYFGQLAPGDAETAHVTVKNSGSLDAWVYIDEQGTLATRSGTVFQGTTPLAIYFDPEAFLVPAGQTVDIPVYYQLPASAGNSYQGATGTADIKIRAVQARNNSDSLQVPINNLYNNSAYGNFDNTYAGNHYVNGTLPTTPMTAVFNDQVVTFSAIPTNGDNWQVGGGGTVSVNATRGYNNVWLLASASHGPSNSNMVVHYKDGSSSSIPFQVSDWIVPGQPMPSNEHTVWYHPQWYGWGSVSGWDYANGTHLYAVSIPVDSAKQVDSISISGFYELHVFGVTLR